MTNPTYTHGWTAVPRDTSTLLNGKKNVKDPEPVTVDSIPLPKTPLAKKVLEYAQKELREETFNHSMRVFYYGTHGLASSTVRGVAGWLQGRWLGESNRLGTYTT